MRLNLILFAMKLCLTLEKTKTLLHLQLLAKVNCSYTFEGKRYPLFKKLEYIESVCDPNQFFRINRQMLVNQKAVLSFEAYFNRKIIMELKIKIVDMTHQLIRHYTRVLEELVSRQNELEQFVSTDYIARMQEGLKHWINAGEQGYLTWGIMHFRLPEK